ncbi:FAD binding domain-containing protein [candidate division KSB1 bacterium]
MKNFKYVEAKSIKNAAAALSNDWNKAVVKCGGTDLLGEMKDMLISPEKVVNISNINTLSYIEFVNDGGVKIGAAATLTEIAESAVIKEKYPVIAQAAAKVGSPQLRNMGTIGGNLCQRPRCWYYRNKNTVCLKKGGSQCYAFTGENKYHCILGGGPCFIVYPSDMAPALIACEAKIKINGKAGERELDLNKFYVLPADNIERENILNPDEIVTEIVVPSLGSNTKSMYYKQGIRETWDFAVCSVAASIKMSGLQCNDIRIVLGGAAPKPWRSFEAENVMKGKIVSESTAESAAKAAVEGAQSLRDNRYKIKLFQNIIKQTILDTVKS